jgi:hypothetical protein
MERFDAFGWLAAEVVVVEGFRSARVSASRSAAEGAKARREEKKREPVPGEAAEDEEGALKEGEEDDSWERETLLPLGRSKDSDELRAEEERREEECTGMKGAEVTFRSEWGGAGWRVGFEVDRVTGRWKREDEEEDEADVGPLKEKALASGLREGTREEAEVDVA